MTSSVNQIPPAFETFRTEQLIIYENQTLTTDLFPTILANTESLVGIYRMPA
ncbi:hypothetical protein [Candidatus Nitrosotenuis uzonensis]|uniref:hypothetical protein n=1 Tax=Candidatus Nitrosotenuis uzonensis TaxID=1407055 RepID=UPI0019617801|nr:hypothetical protein [Candidatus Nitrosotenuis uzonensis]